MRIGKLLAVVALCVVTTSTARAQQTLTFEGFTHLQVLSTQYAGINFQGATVLTKDLGLNPLYPPKSGSNVVYNPTGPMELLFSNSLSFFEGYFTYSSGLMVQGFDVNGILVASSNGLFAANQIGSGNTPNELVGINAAGIRRVVITGGSGNNFTLDDARFTGSVNVVPEPSSLALLAAGASMLAFIRRRQRIS
jgi:PEP-CTERM motif